MSQPIKTNEETSRIQACANCKNTTVNSSTENYHYTACGLKNVTLVGIEVRTCTTCGWRVAVIPNVDGLHKVLAQALVEKKSRLIGGEYRFLRKHLGESSADFAAMIGVSPETISRWENEKELVSPVADRLLRVLVLTMQPRAEYPNVAEQLKDVSRDVDVAPPFLGMRSVEHTWERTSLQSPMA